jgi:outer membrane protein assembly factor BamB
MKNILVVLLLFSASTFSASSGPDLILMKNKSEVAWIDWPQLYGNPEHNNFREQKNEIVCPKILWRVDYSGVPAVVGNDVYAGGQALRLIDFRSGKVKASFKPQDMTEQINFKGTPVVLPDRVIAHGSNDLVYALTRDLSKVIWSKEVWGIGRSSGVSNGDLFIVCADKWLVAIDVKSGKIRWQRGFPSEIVMTPALADGKVLFGTWNRKFYAYDLDGNEVWCHRGTHSFGYTDPAVAFGKVFIGDRGGVVNALDLYNGSLIWKYKSGSTGLSTPGIGKGRIFVGKGCIFVGFGNVVVILDEITGEPDPKGRLFRTGLNPFGSPTLVGDTLYFGNLDGHLYAFDFNTGRYKWSFEVGADKHQQVYGFIYHKGCILVRTTVGLYALGNDPEKKELPHNFVLPDDLNDEQ